MRKALYAMIVALLALPALAAGDAAQGAKLVAEKCNACHQRQMGGDAKAIYLRKDRKVASLAKLKSQVAACNNQLNLQLFPEDEEHIVAFLNETYYKFSAGK